MPKPRSVPVSPDRLLVDADRLMKRLQVATAAPTTADTWAVLAADVKSWRIRASAIRRR